MPLTRSAKAKANKVYCPPPPPTIKRKSKSFVDDDTKIAAGGVPPAPSLARGASMVVASAADLGFVPKPPTMQRAKTMSAVTPPNAEEAAFVPAPPQLHRNKTMIIPPGESKFAIPQPKGYGEAYYSSKETFEDLTVSDDEDFAEMVDAGKRKIWDSGNAHPESPRKLLKSEQGLAVASLKKESHDLEKTTKTTGLYEKDKLESPTKAVGLQLAHVNLGEDEEAANVISDEQEKEKEDE